MQRYTIPRLAACMPACHRANHGRLLAAAVLACSALSTAATAAPAATSAPPAREQLLRDGCKTLAARVAAVPGKGPVMLGSYEPAPGGEPLPPPLQQSAFVYDNALAGVALIACGQPDAARRIADGVVAGATRDRHYHDGRVRNAYRAGAVPDGPVPMPGWWDAPSKRWFEDAYQAGTATGNVAWAALLLLATYESTHERRYLDSAAALMTWVDKQTFGSESPAGYIGGFFGHEPAPRRQGWKSTEHNVDAYAAFRWLALRTNDARWDAAAQRARRFVDAMWQPGEGRFAIGTRDDGRSLNGEPSALDASLWPLIAVPESAASWRRALDWARTHHAVGGGYGFKARPDGVWTEGTGQAALVLRASGRDDETRSLWPLLLAQRAPSGMLFATPEPRISTGLSIGPDSTTEDFYYYHLPHLGATAWAVLAAAGWNPFQPGGACPACKTGTAQAQGPPDDTRRE